MNRRARTKLFAAAAGLVGLRIVVACGGDDESGSSSNLDGGDEANPNSDGQSTPDDGRGVDAGPPAYCDGIVFYASFDKVLTPERGGGTASSAGHVTAEPQGQFGGAIGLVPDSGDPDSGAAHYFVAGEAGAAFPIAGGSLSLWFRAALSTSDPQHSSQVVYRPVGSLPPDPLVSSGLLLTRLNDRFGLYSVEPQTRPILTFSLRELAPYMRAGGFNHWITAWKESPEGGAGPSAYMALNGGVGEVLSDASVDADYRDASPDDAGNLRVPFRAYSSSAWAVVNPPVALRLGAPTPSSSLDGTVDDVVVWNRVLGFDEMAAVYGARAPIGDVCGLR
jgi:hypothetical protein